MRIAVNLTVFVIVNHNYWIGAIILFDRSYITPIIVFHSQVFLFSFLLCMIVLKSTHVCLIASRVTKNTNIVLFPKPQKEFGVKKLPKQFFSSIIISNIKLIKCNQSNLLLLPPFLLYFLLYCEDHISMLSRISIFYS